jgi:hypothetical protein
MPRVRVKMPRACAGQTAPARPRSPDREGTTRRGSRATSARDSGRVSSNACRPSRREFATLGAHGHGLAADKHKRPHAAAADTVRHAQILSLNQRVGRSSPSRRTPMIWPFVRTAEWPESFPGPGGAEMRPGCLGRRHSCFRLTVWVPVIACVGAPSTSVHSPQGPPPGLTSSCRGVPSIRSAGW